MREALNADRIGYATTMYLCGCTLTGIAKELKYSRTHIKNQLVLVGVEIDSKRRPRNNKGCFKKGNTPWNAGKKGITIPWNKGLKKEDHPSISKTGFKPGKAPKNTGRTHFKKGFGYWTGKTRPDMTGEKHPAYKGGKNYVARHIRASLEYKKWRTAVFKRDNYTCQNCTASGVYIEADHIKPFCLYEELRFDINNGRTLCKQCHYKIGWNNFRDNNPKKAALV